MGVSRAPEQFSPSQIPRTKRQNSLPEQHEGSRAGNPPPVVLLVPETGSGVVANRERALGGGIDLNLVLDLEVGGDELVGLGKSETGEVGRRLALYTFRRGRSAWRRSVGGKRENELTSNSFSLRGAMVYSVPYHFSFRS